MPKKLIIIGELNIRHLLPFSLALGQIAYNMVSRYITGEDQNMVLDLFSTSLGIMSIIFIPYIFRFANIESKNVKETRNKKCLHYFLLIFIFIVYSALKSITQRVKGEKEELTRVVNPLSEGPFVNIGVEMFFLTLVSIILLKYKYYAHHIISLVAFIIFGNICDGVLGYYPKLIKYGLLGNFIQLLSLGADVVNYYYQKYMMEVLYYPYWKISFGIGAPLFCFATLLLIYVLADKDKADSQTEIVSQFYLYFEKVHPGLIVGKQLLTLILYFITTSLSMLNIYYFNPNFILIGFHLPKFIQILIDEEPEKYYSLIFFALQFFSLLIYLEIIELNFCNLNKNTKRNIELRGILDLSGENGRDSTVDTGNLDINNDYLIEFRENNNGQTENIIEMNIKSDLDQSSPPTNTINN